MSETLSALNLTLFSSCEISDALLKLGVKNGGHIPQLQMISPNPLTLSDDSHSVICGPAYTVHLVLGSDTTSPKLTEGHFVDLAPEGSVLFIDAPPEAQNAVWGGLMTAGAQSRNCVGTIVSGLIRDTSEHRSSSYPVFARGTSTVGQTPFTRPSAVNIPVTIPRNVNPAETGGLEPVTVRPGDWLVADVDGVVCVPKELLERVAELARKGKEVDARCLEDIRKGVGVKESFKRHRGTGTGKL